MIGEKKGRPAHRRQRRRPVCGLKSPVQTELLIARSYADPDSEHPDVFINDPGHENYGIGGWPESAFFMNLSGSGLVSET